MNNNFHDTPELAPPMNTIKLSIPTLYNPQLPIDCPVCKKKMKTYVVDFIKYHSIPISKCILRFYYACEKDKLKTSIIRIPYRLADGAHSSYQTIKLEVSE